MIASALLYEKQPVGSPLKLDIKCDEVGDNCKMIPVPTHTDGEAPFLGHVRVGATIFDEANALVFCLLKVRFNIHVSAIKLHETGVDQF